MKRSGPVDEDGGDEDLFLHKALARSLGALDKLAEKAELPLLSAFVSEDPEKVYDLVDDEDEAEVLLAKLPRVRWSKPADALPTVKKLIAQLKNAKPSTGIKDPAKFRAELQDIEKILNTGVAKKVMFRFYAEF